RVSRAGRRADEPGQGHARQRAVRPFANATGYPACISMHCGRVRKCALSSRAAGLGLAAGPGLLPGLLEPSRGQPDPALTARLASPVTVAEPAMDLGLFTAHAAVRNESSLSV